MNIELTTENLRECCRFCLNKGEFDIWGQTVDSTTTLELLTIFKNYDIDLLGLNEELKLVCQFCLDNLRSCNEFYKKAVETNKKMRTLYIEAEKIEAEQLVDEALEVLENDSEGQHKPENHIYENDDALMDENETNASLDDLIEEDNYEELEEDQHIESDLNGIEDVEYLIDETEDFNEESTDLFDYVKPLNNTSHKDKTPRMAGPSLPPHEDGSLVVTQFLPSTAHIVFNDASTEVHDSMQKYEDNCSEAVPTLGTVDFSAVEVKSSNFQQMIDEELILQSTKEDTTKSNQETIEAFGSKEDVPESVNSVYVCKYCPQAFAAINYLISHVRKSHVCKYCTQAFSKSMDLFVHIRQRHNQHKCAICKKELSSHSNLRGHIKRVHGIRLPAQVALLHYRPPIVMSDKSYSTSNLDSTSDEIGIHF